MEIPSTPPNLIDSLKCPLTCELFRDPVSGSDGYTYERENITNWIRKHRNSPITGESMDLISLRPNYTVKKMIEEFLSSSSQKQHNFRLNIDICKANEQAIFRSTTKNIYEGRWMLKQGPSIVLIEIIGAKANLEAGFYCKLSCHPHIVRTYGLIECETVNTVMLVQEYAPYGDLAKLLRNNKIQPNDQVFVEIFYQIANAMVCLADNQIIHGDLACRNVLVFRSSFDQPSKVLVKLTDFGLTRTNSLFTVLESSGSSAFNMLPVRSAAPELVINYPQGKYSEKTDVYSFGVLIWEAYSKALLPFANMKDLGQVRQERSNGKRLVQPESCPEEIWSIADECMKTDADQRPNFKFVQEALLKLKYQNERYSLNRDSTTRGGTIDKQRNSTLDNRPRSSTPSHTNRRTTKNVYCNLDQNISSSNSNSSTNEYININLQPIRQETTCTYCLQIFTLADFRLHQNVCSIERSVQLFVKSASRFPLKLATCSICHHIVPENLIDPHEKTCAKNPSETTEDSYLVPLDYHLNSAQKHSSAKKLSETDIARVCQDQTILPKVFQEASIDAIGKSSKTSFGRFLSKFKGKFN